MQSFSNHLIIIYFNKFSDVLQNACLTYTPYPLYGHIGKCTVAYLGHGEKTNYSANPPGRNTNPPGQIGYSARAD